MPVHPSKIGKYEVVGVIGKGGMGVVYKATDPQIGRFVAIKMITSGFAGNPDLLERFYREAKSTGSLQNPNIVTVYDLGDQDGNPYLVMEYLEGVSLESIIASGRPLSLIEKLGIIIDVCNGLSYAHRRGIIHRDIKPANVMVLNDGAAKIVDFGIARIGDSRMTRTDQVIGSINYMSPEQFQEMPLDSRTDIFSAGVTLFQLLTNSLPFSANETAATMHKIVNEPPPPLGTFIRDYPPELDAIVNRALTKDREERYASAKDFAFDLMRVQEQLKQDAVSQYMRRAEGALQRSEWGKAKEHLQQVLRVDAQHAQAHRLLGEVQDKIRRQQRSEQARQLRTHADEAFVDQRYDDALKLLDQALALDEGNPELREFRQAVQEAKNRARKLQAVLHRAEAAQQEGDLEEAVQAVDEALSLDPADTQAKALKLVLTRQTEEQARQRRLRQLLDEAHKRISTRNLTGAFQILKDAEALDPGSVEVQSLMKLATSAREQEARRAELEQVSQSIQEALAHEDYDGAAAQADRGLAKYPHEQGLLKLKTLADAQRQRIERKNFARQQFAAASALLEAGKPLEAYSLLEKAVQKVPDDPQLESLRSIIKEQLSQVQSQEHKQLSLAEAQRAVAAGDLREAVQLLENAQLQFPGTPEIDELLRTIRAQLEREQSLGEIVAAARQLLNTKPPEQAVRYLETRLQEVSDPRLRDLLEDARRRVEQFNRGVDSAVAEGQRILREHGPREAASFLEAQPAMYSEEERLRSLAEAIRKRSASDVLDRQLAKEADPDAQLRLAEDAARAHPGNEGIAKMLAITRERSKQIAAVLDRAHLLEHSRQYGEAAQELVRLRKLYPQHPTFEGEIVRLLRLEQQKKALAERPAGATGAPAPPMPSDDEIRATAILPLRGVPPSAASIPGETRVLPPSTELEQVSPPALEPGRRLWLWVGAGAAALVLLAIAVLLLRNPAVPVRIETDPGDSEVEINGKACHAPCDLRLKPGNYALAISHDGYAPLSQQLSVEAHGTPLHQYRLTLLEQPHLPGVGRLIVQTNIDQVDIFVDGALSGMVGSDRKLALPINEGKHDITAQKQGFAPPPAQSVQVAANTDSPVTFTLKRATPGAETGSGKPGPSYLIIQAPPGALVSLDQQGATAMPSTGSLPLPVAPGSHRVDVKLSGYKPWSTTANPKSGDRLPVVARLEKLSTTGSAAAAPTASLTGKPIKIQLGDSAQLNWNTQNATDVSITPLGSVGPNGTINVSPSQTTSYHLIARAPDGRTADAIFQITVAEKTPPPVSSGTPSGTSSSGGSTSTTPSLFDADRKAIREALDRYRDAYESESLDDMKKIWPSPSNAQQKALKDTFNTFSAIRLRLSYQDQDIHISGDKATVALQQSFRFTQKGKVQPEQSAAANIQLKRSAGGWVVDSVSGR